MWQEFYFNFMTDPFMNELFDMTVKDVAHDHKAHGERLALFFLQFKGDSLEYSKKRGEDIHGNINRSHQRAKACPMREAN